eukprot:gene13372-biopygen9556
MKNTWWVGVDRSWTPLRIFYGEPDHRFSRLSRYSSCKYEGDPLPTPLRWAGRAGQPDWGGSGNPAVQDGQVLPAQPGGPPGRAVWA